MDSLTLVEFRRPEPELFAALWEGGTNPNPDRPLPSLPAKKVRVYLKMAEAQISTEGQPFRQQNLMNLEPFQVKMRPFLEQALQIAPSLTAMGKTEMLVADSFIPYLGDESSRPFQKPDRGERSFCFHLKDLDGGELSREITRLAMLEKLETVDDGRNESEGRTRLLRDRLEMLLSQRGKRSDRGDHS